MTTWNPADIGSGVALSNGDLTATKTGGIAYRSGRGTTSKTTGKKYFECEVGAVTTPANLAAGAVAESTASLVTYLGQGTDSVAYYGDGTVYKNDILLTTLASYGAGQTVGVAIDEDAGKGWFCDASGSYGSGDPGAGTGEHFTFTAGTANFPGFTVYHGTNLDSVTVNFGATAFVHTIPSGFESWDVFGSPLEGSDYFGNAYFGGSYFGGYYWGPQSDEEPEPEPTPEQQPTGGWPISAWQRYKTPSDLRRDREDERRALEISEAEQRKVDRVAVKIARRIAKEGLNADRPVIMAAPAFDSLMASLHPTEGQSLALADAILQRVLWMAQAQQADEESALMALLAEL